MERVKNRLHSVAACSESEREKVRGGGSKRESARSVAVSDCFAVPSSPSTSSSPPPPPAFAAASRVSNCCNL